jgi:hypothetical protein
MKVLVATKETQGRRKNDFCHAEEGEPVVFASECDGERVDGPCGCRRSFVGMMSRKATTTVKVVEAPEGGCYDDFVGMYLIAQKAWLDRMPELKESFVAEANDLLRIAKDLPAGLILEKRGNNIVSRGRAA